MDGSKRHNVQGYVVTGLAGDIQLLRRLSANEVTKIFRHAQEAGQTRITLDDEQYTLHRHSDHTFTLKLGAYGHVIF